MVAGAGLGWGWAVGWAGAGDDSVRYNFPIVMSADQRGLGWAGAGLGWGWAGRGGTVFASFRSPENNRPFYTIGRSPQLTLLIKLNRESAGA